MAKLELKHRDLIDLAVAVTLVASIDDWLRMIDFHHPALAETIRSKTFDEQLQIYKSVQNNV